MATLRWTHASLRSLVGELRRKGIRVGRSTVQRLLRARRYSLRVNQKCIGGPHSPERDAQFRRIDAWRRHFLHAGWPVLSIDTKKKEPVGLFKNAGRRYRRHPRASTALPWTCAPHCTHAMPLRPFLACALAAAVSACYSNPLPGQLAPCRTTADCAPDLQCLPAPVGLQGNGTPAGSGVCSQPCRSTDDCPTVSSSHCGDQTLCTGGVCDYALCL